MISREAVLDAFRFRHACKRFDPERKIADADFEAILEAGRLSPSSFGFEPWQFLVIQRPELREALLPVTWGGQGQLPTASHVVAMLCHRDMRYDSSHVARIMREVQGLPEDAIEKKTQRFRKFQESDFRLLESPRALFDWAGKQAYIALGNMMTTAALLGIDSCPIEGFDMEGAEAVLAKAGVLDGERLGLVVMAAFGYRINPQPGKARRCAEEVVAWVR